MISRQHTVLTRRRGSLRQERLLPALHPGYVRVDEKTFAENLEFLYRYASLIRIFDGNNAAAGDWQRMLENDSSFILASILTTDLSQYPQAFLDAKLRYDRTPEPEPREAALADMFLLTDQLASNLAAWIARLQLLPQDPLNLLATATQSLRTDLRYALTYWKTCLGGLMGISRVNPSRHTGRNLMGDVDAIMAVLGPLLPEPPPDTVRPQFQYLEPCFAYLKTLYTALYLCNLQFRKLLGTRLQESLYLPDHSPHNTLLLTLTGLMEQVRAPLNTFTQQHLDFYYRQVLQLHPAPPVPDQAFILFSLKKGQTAARVPAGTPLLAGKGTAGENLIYLTDTDLWVNTIQVSRYMTVYNSGAQATVPGTGTLYAAPAADSGDGVGGKFPAGQQAEWPPFGQNQALLPATAQNMVPAQAGFAIADPVLSLSMGQRRIRLMVTLAQDAWNLLQSRLQALSTPGSPFQIPGNALKLSWTGPKGWVQASLSQPFTLFSAAQPLPSDEPFAPGACGFWLETTLGMGDPAVTAYDPALHGSGYTPGVPVLQAQADTALETEVNLRVNGMDTLLNAGIYSLLTGLEITAVNLSVKVAGKTDLALQTDSGSLDPKKTWQPLGSSPMPGSHFYIGSPEIFRKQLRSFTLRLNWDKLPGSANGFADYYSTWNQMLDSTVFSNAAFQARFALLNAYTWQPLMDVNGNTQFPLFAWDASTRTPQHAGTQAGFSPPLSASPPQSMPLHFDPYAWLTVNSDPHHDYGSGSNPATDGRLISAMEWTFSNLAGTTAQLNQVPAGGLNGPFLWDATQASGFCRMELSGPDPGFGAALFQQIVFAVNDANLKTISSGALNGKASPPATLISPPQPPFIPAANALSADYEAGAVWLPGQQNQGTFYWMQPFGITQPPAGTSLTLLPEWADEGTLFLGLAQVNAPQPLSLLIQLDENTASTDPTVGDPDVSWAYLYQGAWVPFRSQDILLDGTRNFTQSGIISFMLNAGPGQGGGWFGTVPGADSLLWLRASVAENVIATCKVLSISPQAVTATYQPGPSANTHLATPLPAGTITATVNPVPGIGGASQPMDSSGGLPGESDLQFYTRVQERLRHKGRGVTSWDIERLILQQFPAVNLVNCFSHMSAVAPCDPGEALIVVFPGGDLSRLPNPWAPSFRRAVLEQIRDGILPLLPPGLHAQVVNPPFEALTVRAVVEFSPGLDPGYYLRQLNDDLCLFISPWMQDSSLNPYDTLLSPALIRGYIQSLPYVNLLGECSVVHAWDENGVTHYRSSPDEHAYFEPHGPCAVLTTAQQHTLIDMDSVRAGQAPGLGLIVQSAADTEKGAALGSLRVQAAGTVTAEGELTEYLQITPL